MNSYWNKTKEERDLIDIELREYTERHYGHQKNWRVSLEDGTSVPYAEYMTSQTVTVSPDGYATTKFTYEDEYRKMMEDSRK